MRKITIPPRVRKPLVMTAAAATVAAIAFVPSAVAGPTNSVSSSEVVNHSLNSIDMDTATHNLYSNTKPAAGQVTETALDAALKAKVNAVGTGTPGADGKSYGCDGNVVDATHPAAVCPGTPGLPGGQGVPGDKGEPGDPASDVFGKAGVDKDFAAKTIEHLGGPYFDGFTTIGSFDLTEGTWLVNTSVKFTRTVAGAEGSRPQVGLRIGQGTASPNWGTEVGTVGGAEISPVKNHDLFGSSVKVIKVTSTSTVGVYSFGYNNDTGTAGSGQIDASVSVSAVRVG